MTTKGLITGASVQSLFPVNIMKFKLWDHYDKWDQLQNLLIDAEQTEKTILEGKGQTSFIEDWKERCYLLDQFEELSSILFQKKLSEITTTASIDTYQTPYAFGKKINKKRKKNIEKQTGFKFIDEAVSKEDMDTIRKQIRREVSDIIFKIWLKRTSWGGK